LRRRSTPAARLKLAAAALLFVAIAGVSQLPARLAAPDPLEYRREFARSSIAMICEHPWRGFGLGTFQDVYPAYASFDPGSTVDHAHNDWLEWAAEGGIPFAAVWAALALAIAPAAIRSVWGIGIIAVFLHALVDYPFARLGVAAWVFVLIGAVAAASVEKSAARGPLSR